MSLWLLISLWLPGGSFGVPFAGDGLQESESVLLVEYNCGLAKLGRADEIVAAAFAPIMNDLVEQDRLSGWVWLTRDVGDEWNRAFYVTSTDRTRLLESRDEVAARLTAEEDALRVEFLSICGESRFRVYRIAMGRPR